MMRLWALSVVILVTAACGGGGGQNVSGPQAQALVNAGQDSDNWTLPGKTYAFNRYVAFPDRKTSARCKRRG